MPIFRGPLQHSTDSLAPPPSDHFMIRVHDHKEIGRPTTVSIDQNMLMQQSRGYSSTATGRGLATCSHFPCGSLNYLQTCSSLLLLQKPVEIWLRNITSDLRMCTESSTYMNRNLQPIDLELINQLNYLHIVKM